VGRKTGKKMVRQEDEVDEVDEDDVVKYTILND